MTKRQRISPDFRMRPKRGYRKTDDDSYSQHKVNTFVFSSKYEDWAFSKYRKHAQYPNLF